MEMESRKLSYYSLEPHLLNLRFGGYYQIDPRSPKLQKALHKVYMCITLILIIFYTAQQAIRVFQVRDDMDKVMGTMFLFLTHTDSILKQIVLWVRAEQVEDLLDTMRGPLYNQKEADHRECLLRTARHGKFLLRMNNTLAIITCFLWVLYPVILHIQEKQIEFAIWLPFDVNANPQFYLSAIYVWIMTSWLAVCNTTIDVMVAFLLAQCETQLFLLRDDLTKLVQRSKEEALHSRMSYRDILSRRFETNIKHHVEIVQIRANICKLMFRGVDLKLFWLRAHVGTADNERADELAKYAALHKRAAADYKFAKKVQDIFGYAVAYQFLVSGWIICTSVYKMVQIDPLSVQFLSMIMYIICMLMQLFLYCYYGSQVTHQSEMLTYSAYAMKWLQIPLEHRRHLIIFMERIKHSIQPLAGFIVPLSNNTFVSIIKSSYTFYAILKNTNK